jgi:OOP family OmpA-OmpF porin
MMKRLLNCLAALLLIAAATLPEYAHADAQDDQGYFSAMGTYIDDDEISQLDDGFTGGQFGFGRALNNWWNMEAYLSFANLEGFPGQDQSGFGADLQLVLNRQGGFTPYLFVGTGYLLLDPDGADDSDGMMLAGGAGFLADIFGSSNVALRAEYRLRSHEIADIDTEDNLFSLGLQMPFGHSEPAVVDADGDGVPDGIDRCPETPPGTTVDQFGCEPDSDGDGVVDSADRCPGTPEGVRVDAYGCASDSDGDGVADDADECPDTRRGATVDERGCEPDGDRDGVVDRLDDCPNTPAGVQVDVKGCEIKAEIRLPGVNFETNSDRLLPGAESVLDDAAATLKKNPSIIVEVAGHTDSDGSAEYNEGLSARRATTVRDYLITKDVPEARLAVRGYGESVPVADNSTATGKAENRRVVLRIVER